MNIMAAFRLPLVVALLWPASVLAALQEAPAAQLPEGDDPTPFSSIELVSDVSSIRPGVPFTLGVHITVDPGWHTYWINGGDAGDELLVDWSVPEGFEVGDFLWPVPHLLPAPPLMSYGYEDQLLVLAEVTPPTDLAPGSEVEISGAADYQVCADICLIALDEIEISLPVRDSSPVPDQNWAGTITDTRSRIPGPADGWAVRAWAVDDPDAPVYVLELAADASSGLPNPASLPAPHLFADSAYVIEHASPQRVVRTPDAIRLEIPRNYFESEFAERIGGLVVADVESETPVAWHVEASVEPVPEDRPDLFAPADADVQQTGGVPEGMAPLGRPPPIVDAESRASLSLSVALLFALLGGLTLNLMPCVFPVLSMKVLGLVGKGQGSPASARRHGYAFAAGVVMSFWLLAGLLMALRAAGESVGWGFQLQSPLVVGLLAVLLFTLALSLSGLFEVGLGLTRLGAVGSSERYSDSVLMGGLTVLVATPCTAPFMGAALGYALVQPKGVGLAVFTALAIGLAAPYVLLSSSPALLRHLPRPGAWMATFKQAMAFPLYATVVWLVWVFGNQAGLDSAAMLMSGLVAVAVAAWIYGRFGGIAPSARVRASALLVALVGVGLVVQGARAADPPARVTADRASGGWETFTPERLEALRAEGRPVFIDFTADWCLSCKVNERVALQTQEVESAFAEANVALLVADWTNRDPVIAEAIEGYGRSGVPLYVLYPRGPAAAPEILPALLTPGLVVEAVRRASE